MELTHVQPREYEEDEFDLDIRVIALDEAEALTADRAGFTGGFITCECTHHPPHTCNEACL
jgi:hypothetical protein